MAKRQTTIAGPISCYGIGVHSGRDTQLTLKPAKANTGIVFVRTDIKSTDNVIPAIYSNVYNTSLSTSIKNDANATISTIEHLLAALWGFSVDNVIVEVDGPEVPIMDGSSKPFLFMIECAGINYLEAAKRKIKLLKEIIVKNGDSEIIASPDSSTKIELSIDFNSKAIGYQQFSFTDQKNFKDQISDSRTFGFINDLEYLKEKGLAKGASLENAIGIENDKILNTEGLRHQDEFVRHKILDLLGDLYTSGSYLDCKIEGKKTSHSLNNEFLRKIFENTYSYEWVFAV